MKTKIATALLMIISFDTYAVSVSKCPSNLTIVSSDLRFKRPLDSVLQELTDLTNPYPEQEAAQKSALTAAYQYLRSTPKIERAWPLKSAKNSSCIYRNIDDRIEQARIYTSKGKDWLDIRTLTEGNTRGTLYRIYAQIEFLSTSVVQLAQQPAGSALAIPRWPYTDYSAGGAQLFIGKTHSIAVNVK